MLDQREREFHGKQIALCSSVCACVLPSEFEKVMETVWGRTRWQSGFVQVVKMEKILRYVFSAFNNTHTHTHAYTHRDTNLCGFSFLKLFYPVKVSWRSLCISISLILFLICIFNAWILSGLYGFLPSAISIVSIAPIVGLLKWTCWQPVHFLFWRMLPNCPPDR